MLIGCGGVTAYSFALDSEKYNREGRKVAFPSLSSTAQEGLRARCSVEVLGWSSWSESPEKLILYCADFSLRDSENPGDFFYCINLTIDAEAHSDDSLFPRRQCGQELSGLFFRMTYIRQSRFPCLKLPLHRLFGACRSNNGAYEAFNQADCLPAITLIDQKGREVSLSSLKGKPVVVDFIYTRCPGPCLLLTQKMARVAARLASRILARVWRSGNRRRDWSTASRCSRAKNIVWVESGFRRLH